MRVGIVGLASSHVDQIVRLVRTGRLGPDVQVTALAHPGSEPVDAGRVEALLATPGWTRRPPDPLVISGAPEPIARAMSGEVDAVLVATRDAATHRELADPLLRAGLPLLVDKPFTATSDDAAHLVRLARRGDVPLTSFSALRWHPAVQRLAGRWAGDPDGIVVTASGPADPAGPYGGLPFYGVHAVEMALTAVRAPVDSVTVAGGAGTRTALLTAGPDVAVVQLLTPRDGRQTPFALAVAGADGQSAATVELGPDYLLPGLRVFLDAVSRGTSPVPSRTLLDSVRVLEALTAMTTLPT